MASSRDTERSILRGLTGTMKRFFAELKRRHIYRFGVVYLALAWLLIQVIVNVKTPLNLPPWSDTLVITLLAIGFPVILLFAWTLESRSQDAPAMVGALDSVRPATAHAVAPEPIRPEISFCTTASGYRLAHAKAGSGLPLLRTGNWLSHQELDWTNSLFGPFLRDFSRSFQVFTYDGRGTGLSDREVTEFSLDSMVEDMETVADANRLERFAILAFSQSCAVSITYAVRHPERVSRMVLFGGFAHNFRTPEEVDAIATLFRQNWGQDNAATRQIFTSAILPDATKEEFDAFNEIQRRSISPEAAARLFKACHAIDVRDLARRVTTPTLVMHSRDEPGVPLECGREIASLIPGARFITLESRNHVPVEREPAYKRFLEEAVPFLQKG